MTVEPVTEFDQWYTDRSVNTRTGALEFRNTTPCAQRLVAKFESFKREMDARLANYWKLEMLADGEVLSKQKDLPNVSSGETAGMVRRIARNVVQNTPNVEVISKFDDDSAEGVFVRHMLLEKIIGSDNYSNDMQQNLFASTISSCTLGFDCVVPVLLQHPAGDWYIKYDTIHYRDVFPEPGVKDVRQSQEVFIRRYLTKGDIRALIQAQTQGWDIPALRRLAETRPPARDRASNPHQSMKHHSTPDGYEIVTWYSASGDPFLTFSPSTGILLRIEKNKHPDHAHPVHFLILEKDPQQPFGKSLVELLLGRQEFQDLMLNGAMKLWYRNINPSIIGYGTMNATPNLGPGKYTQVSNPNAKIEAFEVNTQTLLQYGQISQQNLGSMVNLVGSADQQMATQAGNGMSATPQGVNAQQQMVDITTNNFQKAIESFFSHYCSYALTIYFQEMKSIKKVVPTADARQKLVAAGLPVESFNEDGVLEMDFSKLATDYFVRCVPGSLVEMEDEKQLRILNQLFVPLSQAMPALANVQDQDMLQNAARAMNFIIRKEIELSGSSHADDIKQLMETGDLATQESRDSQLDVLERDLGGMAGAIVDGQDNTAAVIQQMQEQIGLLVQTQTELMKKLGMDLNTPMAGDNPVVENDTGAPAPVDTVEL